MAAFADRFRRGLDLSLDHVELRRQAAVLLRGSGVGYDLAVWAVVDPATVMWTSCVMDGMDRDVLLESAVFANEYGQDDVLKLAELAAGERIGSLAVAAGGDPMSSARFREVLTPRGFTDELRLIFHDGGSSWGALCLLRSRGRFSTADTAALAPIGRIFGSALRVVLVRERVAPVLDAGPRTGIVVPGGGGCPPEVNDDARTLIGQDLRDIPEVVQALLARRHAGQPATATAPTSDGRWLTWHASSLHGSDVVLVEEVRPHQLAELIVRGRGLTGRERRVLAAVARGRTNRQIATELGISPYTVQDHVKAVLAKFDVSSRTELVAALFFDHYLPAHGFPG